MANRTPADAAALWSANLANAQAKIKQSVTALTDSPMEKAAASQDLMRRRLVASIDDGTWAANLRAVPLQSWKNAMLGKGLANMQSGLKDGATKVQAFQQMAAPYFQQARQAAAAIPKDGSDQTALAKVAAALQVMRQLKGKRA